MGRHARPAPAGALTAVAALTTWVTLQAWGGFVAAPARGLDGVALGIAVVALTGYLARRVRLPIVVVLAAQCLVVMLVVNLMWGTATWPSPTSIEATLGAFRDAVHTSREYSAPVSPEAPPLAPLLVGGGLLCHLLVDLIAVTVQRVAVAGLPLLLVYTLPVSLLERPVSGVTFVFAALGYLLMLAVNEDDRVRRWGRATRTWAGRSAARQAVGVAAASVAVAVLLPVLLPTFELTLFPGGGLGEGGNRKVRITNPMTDLRRDLNRGDDVALLRVRGATSEPSYIRISALTSFSGAAWSPGDRDLPAENAATGFIPRPTGLSAQVPRTTEPWRFEATAAFESTWLPTPMYAGLVDADDDWRYDAEVLDVHAAAEGVTAADEVWVATSVDPRFDARELADMEAPPVQLVQKYTALPNDLPAEIRSVAAELTANADTKYEKAVVLQNWFRREFDYSLETRPGNGGDLLVEFLQDRIGYCEQFASAMAVMARGLDIPARVSVGFIDPDRIGDRSYEFSAHDLHAWPELYFEDAGWVRFEPTPGVRAPIVPAYTRQGTDEPPGQVGPGNLPTATAGPDPERPTEGLDDPGAAGGGDDGGGRSLVAWLVSGLIVLAGLGLLALVPQAVRRTRAARRWHVHGPAAVEAAWSELRDIAVDCRLTWPAGRSPRATAAVLAKEFAAPPGRHPVPRPETGPRQNPEATASLRTLVRAVEQARYAAVPDVPPADVLRDHVARCREALRSGLTRQARWRADWFPASVISLRAGGVVRPTTTRVRSDQDVVDRVGV